MPSVRIMRQPPIIVLTPIVPAPRKMIHSGTLNSAAGVPL